MYVRNSTNVNPTISKSIIVFGNIFYNKTIGGVLSDFNIWLIRVKERELSYLTDDEFNFFFDEFARYSRSAINAQ